MASKSEVDVERGWASYRQGDWAGAERYCQQVLSAAPGHGGALGLLGILRLTAGRADEAAALLGQAVQGKPLDAVLLGGLGLAQLMRGDAVAAEAALRAALRWGRPDDALVQMRLGLALGAQGKHCEAVVALRRAQAQAPDEADVLLNLANALTAAGEPAEAESLLLRLLKRQPEHGDARFNLGTLYTQLGRLDDAATQFRQLLARYPQKADVHNNLGIVLERQGQLDAAAEAYRQVLALDGKHISGLNNLGNVLRAQGREDEAAECYAQAMAQVPGHADSYLNMGVLRVGQERLEEACTLFRKALAVDPVCLEAAVNLSLTSRDMDLADAAITAGYQAVAIAPESTEAHRKLAHALLWAGQLPGGWTEYEWRLRESRPGLDRFALPRWEGAGGPDVRLLLWNEQGVGDEILYLGLVSELADRGIEVTVEADSRLAAMIARSMPQIRVLPRTQPHSVDLSQFTHQLTLASLCRFLRPSLADFPEHAGYLFADASYAARIRASALDGASGPLVGLSWLSSNKEVGRSKSIDLLQFADVLGVPGAHFMNLQYGDVQQDLQVCARVTGKTIHGTGIDLYSDLEGLAAACAACDLVISISSVAAHMAGALGRPVWLLAPKGRGRFWYWFRGWASSPWYPAMQVLEQRHSGDWQGVLAEAAAKLRQFDTGQQAGGLSAVCGN